MNRNEIEDVVRRIMREDGPDGHVDGCDVIADFICALVEGRGEEWERSYRSKRQRLAEDPEYVALKAQYPEAFQ